MKAFTKHVQQGYLINVQITNHNQYLHRRSILSGLPTTLQCTYSSSEEPAHNLKNQKFCAQRILLRLKWIVLWEVGSEWLYVEVLDCAGENESLVWNLTRLCRLICGLQPFCRRWWISGWKFCGVIKSILDLDKFSWKEISWSQKQCSVKSCFFHKKGNISLDKKVLWCRCDMLLFLLQILQFCTYVGSWVWLLFFLLSIIWLVKSQQHYVLTKLRCSMLDS